MTPEEFKEKAQEIYDKYEGDAGESGHAEIDWFLTQTLNSLGYEEGTKILWKMKNIWYA